MNARNPGAVGGRGIGAASARRWIRGPGPASARAFSLLEVMIALAIFFMAAFVILESVSQSLGAARLIQQEQSMPDAGSLIAELYLTNRIDEGLAEGDFGDAYPGFTWSREAYLVATNGLFQVDFTIRGVAGRKAVEAAYQILLWRPDSQGSSFGRQLNGPR